MKRKGLITHLLVAAMLVSSISVAGNSGDVAAKAKKAPKLNATSKNLEVGKSTTVKVKANGTKIKKTTWKTNKKKVATVKGKKTSAKITAKGKGTAKITATVKYNGGKKKLTCTVKVKEAEVKATDAPAATTVAATQAAAATATATQQAVTQPTTAPTEAPTPTPTPKPYYYDEYKYFGKFDAGKAGNATENMYINFVMSDAQQTNTKVSAIKSIEFEVDSEQSATVELWVSEFDCDIASSSAKKVCDFTVDGSKYQKIKLESEIAGNAAINAIDSSNNGRISFGFSSPDGKASFIIHDMYVNYTDKNLSEEAHHEAAISEVTCGIGSATTAYKADKKVVSDANDKIDEENKGKSFSERKPKERFDKTIADYINAKPEGMFATSPKDASKAIEEYPIGLADITEKLGYKFGTVVTYDQIMNDPEFCKLVAHHCDSITAKNEFKAYSLLDEEATLKAFEADSNAMPQMNYTQADAICDWAVANGLKIRGHALVWDNLMETYKGWFFREDYDENKPYASNDVCRERLKSYVKDVMRHFQEKYPDLVYCWDVVNEGIDGGGIRKSRMGDNPFYKHCSSEANGAGEDYIKFTFDCAYDTREEMIADGTLKGDNVEAARKKLELVYNDYNIVQDSSKRKVIKSLVERLNSDPERQLVDTVGCQGYLGEYQSQGDSLTEKWWTMPIDAITEFSSMNPSVNVQLTEMSMRNFEWSRLDQHGEYAQNLFENLANINDTTNGSFTSMSVWAFIDNPIMNKVDDGADYVQYQPFSGMFDDVYRVKPAFSYAYNILKKKAEDDGKM